MITMLGKRELVALFFFDMWVFVLSVNCLFAFSVGVIDRLCSVIVALPGHLLYYFCRKETLKYCIDFLDIY